MIIVAYLAGSISSAILVCKMRGLPDPRENGSGNPGATNVLRIGGASSALLVLFFDMLKGAVPSYLSYLLGLDAASLGFIAVAACLGHIYPVFFQFKGGKGVATYVGILFSINIVLGLVFIISWAVTFLISKYSSLSSLVGSLMVPMYLIIFENYNSIFFIIMFVLIFYTHRENVKRLKNKEETKTKIY